MDITVMSTFSRWLYAAKVNSWPKLLVPFFLGQALGIQAGGSINMGGFVIGFLFTAFGLAFRCLKR